MSIFKMRDDVEFIFLKAKKLKNQLRVLFLKMKELIHKVDSDNLKIEELVLQIEDLKGENKQLQERLANFEKKEN